MCHLPCLLMPENEEVAHAFLVDHHLLDPPARGFDERLEGNHDRPRACLIAGARIDVARDEDVERRDWCPEYRRQMESAFIEVTDLAVLRDDPVKR